MGLGCVWRCGAGMWGGDVGGYGVPRGRDVGREYEVLWGRDGERGCGGDMGEIGGAVGWGCEMLWGRDVGQGCG